MVGRLTGATMGQRIREAYVRAGLNRSQFSKLIGIDYAQIIQWEKDAAKPKSASLEAVATATGVSVDDLLGRGATPSDADPAAFLDFVRVYGPTLRPALQESERADLLAIRFHRATPEKYLAMLQLIRDGSPDPASDAATSAAQARGEAWDVKPRAKKKR